MENLKLNTVEEAIEDIREGKFVIVVDDEDRENEGDLIIAAEKIDAEKVNFMLKHARGVLCVPITMSRCKELDLPHQVSDNTSMLGTPFTVTVDKLEGCSTGVSAHDRAETIKALADPSSKPTTFGRPGHVNPLYAQDNGVRQGIRSEDDFHQRYDSIQAQERGARGKRRRSGHADGIRTLQTRAVPPDKQRTGTHGTHQGKLGAKRTYPRQSTLFMLYR